MQRRGKQLAQFDLCFFADDDDDDDDNDDDDDDEAQEGNGQEKVSSRIVFFFPGCTHSMIVPFPFRKRRKLGIYSWRGRCWRLPK